jgi:hypothetical protein
METRARSARGSPPGAWRPWRCPASCPGPQPAWRSNPAGSRSPWRFARRTRGCAGRRRRSRRSPFVSSTISARSVGRNASKSIQPRGDGSPTGTSSAVWNPRRSRFEARNPFIRACTGSRCRRRSPR